jgi:hypothetical protein
MEYVTEEQLEEFGMNIMHITGGHVELISGLVAQCNHLLDCMNIMSHTIEDLQVRVAELEAELEK